MTRSSDTRGELAQSAAAVGLTQERFALVGPHDYEQVLLQIFSKFTSLGRRGLQKLWLWEHFTGDTEQAAPDEPFAFIRSLVDANEPIWFVAEDFAGDKKNANFWVYQTTTGDALAVLGESHPFEYYLIARDLSWLLCENHHGLVIGVGPSVVAAMRRLDAG